MGIPYGMEVSVFSTPEALWGYEYVTSAYGFTPEESGEKVQAQIRRFFSQNANKQEEQT